MHAAGAYAGFLHETYPPFQYSTTAQDPGGHPVTVNYVPALTDRNRLSVGLRIFYAIPAALILFVMAIIAGICWFIGLFAILFTGKWPAGLHGWVIKYFKASVRFYAYVFLLTDEMPPLNFD